MSKKVPPRLALWVLNRAMGRCEYCHAPQVVIGQASRTGRIVPLFNPRLHVWDEHFRWSRDWTRVIGRTSTGRATVLSLDMNASLLQRARPFWRAAGLIP